MNKELPVWAGLLVGLAGGLLLLAWGIFTDDPEFRRFGLEYGCVLLLLGAYGVAKWAWSIHKGRVPFDALKKSPEQINREADAALREAADLIRRNKHDEN